jgi:hypothetical protein
MSFARAERRRSEREARRDISAGDRAAHSLMAAIVEALTQLHRFETRGLAPGDVPGEILSEDGEPLAERLPGTDAAGRVIVVTRKATLDPAVWYYTSREAGLDAMTRPAVAAFNAAKAGRPISPLMWRAMSCHVMALADAKARDAVVLAAMSEGGRA